MVTVEELIQKFDRAFDKRKAGDYYGALRDFEKLERLSEHPQDIAALRLFQATCLTDMGNPEEAFKRISQVDKSQLLFPKRVDYEYERARIERGLGHLKNALEITEKAIKLGNATDDKDEIRGVTDGLCTLHGILLAESGRCDEAAPVLSNVPREDLGWAEATIHLGDCKFKKGQFREAIEIYLSVVLSKQNVGHIYHKTATRNIGAAYYYLREYTKAIEYLTKVEHDYEETPELKAELFGLLASGYSHLGMTQEAAKYAGFSKGTKLVQ